MRELLGRARGDRLIKRRAPDVGVIIVTSFDNQEYLREAIEAGACGYLLKGTSRDSPLSAIFSAGGGSLFDAAMRRQLVVQRSPHPPAATGALDELTARELATLRLVLPGMTNRAIAARLGYSVGTVKSVVPQLTDRLGVSDRTQEAHVAVRSGLELDVTADEQP